MDITIKDIAEVIENIAPTNTAEAWDNVGLLVGDYNRKVNKVLIALDVDDKVLQEAIDIKAELIISHHPFIFSPINKINSDDYTGRLLLKAIENKIGVYSAHTNLDMAEGGTNDVLTEIFELEEIEPIIIASAEKESSLGRIGHLKSTYTLKQLADYVKEKLETDIVRFVGDGDKTINKVAVVAGSGGNSIYINQAIKQGADALITGDIKYHVAQEALQNNLCLVDGTHYALEVPIVKKLKRYIEGSIKGIEIICSEIDGQVFNT